MLLLYREKRGLIPSNRIQILRKRAGLSQAELAHALSVHQTAVSQWETGKTSPDLSVVKTLADFFKTSIDDILGRTDNSTPQNENTPNVTPLEAFRIYAREKLGHDPSPEELRDIDLAADIVIKRLESERK